MGLLYVLLRGQHQQVHRFATFPSPGLWKEGERALEHPEDHSAHVDVEQLRAEQQRVRLAVAIVGLDALQVLLGRLDRELGHLSGRLTDLLVDAQFLELLYYNCATATLVGSLQQFRKGLTQTQEKKTNQFFCVIIGGEKGLESGTQQGKSIVHHLRRWSG